MHKVMLIYPPFTQPIQAKKRCMVPLGISYIGAYLRQNNIEVELLDCVVEGYDVDIIVGDQRTFGLGQDDIKKKISEFNPDFVGVSCLMTTQRFNTIMVCKIAKEVNEKIHTVVGGCHPSVFPEEMLQSQWIDSVVVGEGERAMLDIVQNRLKGIIHREILDINKIPEPARDSINKYIEINMPENIFSPYDRVTQMVTSRGCPFSCSFCATTRFHGKWRGRKSEDVIKEIKKLKEQYNIQEINFVDENLVMNRERTIEILKGLSNLKVAWSNPGGIWIDGLDFEILNLMKASGCYQLTFPVETSNEKILRQTINKPLHLEKVPILVKHCHKLGIDVHAFFICGFPEQTKEDMINDFKYAKKVGFDSASFHILSPLPGSPLYEKYKDSLNLDEINYIHSTIPHPTLSKKEIENLVDGFNYKFNKSLIYRHPIKYYRKYIRTAKKKFDMSEINSLFKRI